MIDVGRKKFQWNTDMMIHDARMLIEHVLKEDTDVIAERLTTNQYFVAHPGDNDYAREHYNTRVAEVLDPVISTAIGKT